MRVSALVLCALVGSATGFSLQQGEAWLKSHPDPQADELDELKGTNPSAYALVKALLMKRQLGLLDPKHPTASFAAKPAAASSEPSGPEAFAKFASVGAQHSEEAAPEYPEAPAPKHHDWLDWKPSDSAASEDAEVASALGAVSQLASKKNLRSRTDDSEQVAKQTVSEVSAAPKEAPIASKDNSYLKDIDLGGQQPLETRTSTQENSYLKGLNLGGDDVQQQPAKASSAKPQSNLLASFSWDDASQPAKQERTPSFAAQRTVVAEAAPHVVDALSSWLDGSKPASKPKIALATQATKKTAPVNSYMLDLQ